VATVRRFFEAIVDHPYFTIGVICLITLGFLAFIPRLRTDTDFSHYIDKDDPTVMGERDLQSRDPRKDLGDGESVR
jgi:predicted RND superfamily exporter protein